MNLLERSLLLTYHAVEQVLPSWSVARITLRLFI